MTNRSNPCAEGKVMDDSKAGYQATPSALEQQMMDRVRAEVEALRAFAEIGRLRAEVEALRAENHNLNWALGTPGYNTMATPAEQAEHEAAVARIDAVLARMEKAKEEHAAMTADAERYRFMDEHCGIVDMISDPDNLVQVWVAEQRYCGSTLDAAIDAARAAQGGRG
jgi:hypothetical protein